MDSKAAKQFLISKTIGEAKLEQITLSEIEEKMLYFTEVHPTLPDIYEVNAEFEKSYDSDEYEAKIAWLLRNARDRDRKESPSEEQEWKDALDSLKKEDHYILVMVNRAFRSAASSTGASRARDFMIYIAIGIGVVLVLLLVLVFLSKAGK